MERQMSEKKKSGDAVIAVDSSSDEDMDMSVEDIAPSTNSNGRLAAPNGQSHQAMVDLCSPPVDKKKSALPIRNAAAAEFSPEHPPPDRASRRLARLGFDISSSHGSSSSSSNYSSSTSSSSSSTRSSSTSSSGSTSGSNGSTTNTSASSKRHCPANRRAGGANVIRESSDSSVDLGGFSDLNFGGSRSSSNSSTSRRSPRRKGRSSQCVDSSHGDFDEAEYEFGDGTGHSGGGSDGFGASSSKRRRGLDYHNGGGGSGISSGVISGGITSSIGGSISGSIGASGSYGGIGGGIGSASGVSGGSRIFAEVAAARAAMEAAEAEHAAMAAEQKAMSRAVSASNQEVLGSQDYEFLQSLEADKQKTREKKAEEEAEAERAALADALALSTAMHAQSEEDRAAAARAEAAASLPPEPAKGGGEACVTVCFRLPPLASVSRLERRFRPDTDTVDTLLTFLRSREELSGVATWSLRQGHGAQGGPLGTNSSSSSGCGSSSAGAVLLSSLGLGARALLLVQDDGA